MPAEKVLIFIENIITSPMMEGVGILTVKVKFWRFKSSELNQNEFKDGYTGNEIVASESFRLLKFGVELLRQIRD